MVLDFDHEDEETNRGAVARICKKLNAKDWTYSVFYTGNKGYHIHIFFPQIMKVVGDDDKKVLKELFIRSLYSCKKKHYRCRSCSGKIKDNKPCPMLEDKVDLQLTGKHMIRMEYSVHDKTNKPKSLLVEIRGVGTNELPQPVLQRFYYIKQRMMARLPKSLKSTKEKQCVRFFLSNKFTDGRKRIMFVLIKNLMQRYTRAEVRKIMNDWNKEVQHCHIQDRVISSAISTAYANGQMIKVAPRCSYIKQVLLELGRKDVCKGCRYDKS